MYAKLIFKNAKRSVRDYLIYMITLTICVTLFYSFLSISSSYYQPDIGAEYDFTMLSAGMKAAICSITLLLLFLIRFVNHYMLRCRQKEFAVQSVMGMEPKTIGRIFFAETLIMGLLSIGAGIFLGVFFSQFITALLLTSYGKEYALSWTLFPDTVLWTISFFTLSFLVTGMQNTRAIRKTKVIEMLTADRKNDIALHESHWIRTVVILYAAFTIWMCFTGVQTAWFYYDRRFALPVRLMFVGNILFPAATLLWMGAWPVRAAYDALRRSSSSAGKKNGFHAMLTGLPVCAVLNAVLASFVPVLTRRYYLPLHAGTFNQYFAFILVDLLFFLCALIYLTGSLLVAWKERSPEHRYKNENLFFFGQIISKLNTTSKTMTLVSITLALAIFLFIAAPVLTGWASGYLDVRSMYDIQIASRYNNVYGEKDLPQSGYESVTEFLRKHDVKTAYDCAFCLYLPEKSDFHNRMKYDFPVAAISLHDYNAIRHMLGYAPVSLAENEFTTHWKVIATADEREDFLTKHPQVMTDVKELTLSEEPSHEEAMGETLYNTYTDVLYVFPDSVCESLLPVMRNRYIRTAKAITYEDARALEKRFTEEYPEQPDVGASYLIRLRTLQINSSRAGNFVLQASMLYGAVVLMVICLTVLSLQQLLDAGAYRYRFSVLQKMGVDEQRIERLITKQLGVWFGLPVVLAVAVSAAVIVYFLQTISAEVSAYIGVDSLLRSMGATAGILLLLLICYYLGTWVLFKRSVCAQR